jgi:hypothetical protein
MAKRGWIIVGVVVVGVAVFALWPRGPRLEWYSKSFAHNGGIVKVEVLVPSGYEHYEDLNYPRYDPPKQRKRILATLSWTRPRPRSLLDSLPEGMGRFLRQFRPEYVCENVRVTVGDAEGEKDESVHVSVETDPMDHIPGQWYRASRSVMSEPRANLEYGSYNHAEFNATYRQICNSFRVIREK